MIPQKSTSMKPLFESHGGLHLSAYLEVSKNNIQRQLEEVIDMATEFLEPVQTQIEMESFLDPIRHLSLNVERRNQLDGTIALFRRPGLFRILRLPIRVDHQVVVASSFHVKPLMRWLQSDKAFLFVGVERKGAHLYRGGRYGLEKVDSIHFSSLNSGVGVVEPKISSVRHGIKVGALREWVNEWVYDLCRLEKMPIYFAGSKRTVQPLVKTIRYPRVVQAPVQGWYHDSEVEVVVRGIRDEIQRAEEELVEMSRLEYHWAENQNLALKNIHEIAKSVVNSQVKKLMITDQVQIYGKLNRTTGDIVIHPDHLDHEDDCLLDDLAQEVLRRGGQVVVASRHEIPKGRPVLAVLKSAEWVTKPASISLSRDYLNTRVRPIQSTA